VSLPVSKELHYLCTAVVVHCRKHRSDHGILKSPSTSAKTYWQFEKERDPLVVSMGEVEGRGGGRGEEEKGEWKRGMKMILSLSLGELLSWGERCRIKHVPTRKYLAVVQSEEEYKV